MVLYLCLAIAVGVAGLLLWLAFGRGPRRRRAYQRAQRLLQQGDWSRALALAQTLERHPRLSELWQSRLRN